MPQRTRTAKGVLSGLLGVVGLSAVAGVLVTATVAPAMAITGSAATQAIDLFEDIPNFLQIDRAMERTTFYYTNPDGSSTPFAQFYDQNRIPVTYEQVSPIMYEAILSSEDKNFYDHGGVDLVGTFKALLGNIQGTSTRGGSTVSQQFVKNVLIQNCEQKVPLRAEDRSKQLEDCWTTAAESEGTAGIERKLQEMRYAIQIEKEYSKQDILLGYLNLSNFGGVTYGIEAAAQRYFSTSAANLSISQAATLAGMVQNPNSYRIDQREGSMYDEDTDSWYNSEEDGYAETLTRRNYVLERMLKDGKITQEEYDAAYAEPITPVLSDPPSGCASTGPNAYFCQYVKNTILKDPAFGDTPEIREELLRRGGLDVYTTLDPRIQGGATEAMQAYVEPAIEGIDLGGSAVTLENSTGRILAIAQNTLFSEDAAVAEQPGYSSLVYAGDAMHGDSIGFSLGSTYKIFTLLDWLEKGHSLNETLNGTNRLFTKISCDGQPVWNASEVIGNAGGNRGYSSTVLEFTKASLNSGYLAMAERLNLCDINRLAERLGVHYGDGKSVTTENVPFDILGSKNIAPVDMASALSAIATNGTRCTPHIIDRIVGPEGNELPLPASSCDPVLDPAVASTAAYALEQVMQGNGTGSSANPYDGVPVIGKTGTHNDQQTALISATTKTSTAVWVGQSQGDVDLDNFWSNGNYVPNIRYDLIRDIQTRANEVYGGDEFPGPSDNLTRRVLTDVPSVIGMSVEDATRTLDQAGFSVAVTEPVPSQEPVGTIVAQDPSGQAAGGATISISPSDGKGSTIPNVIGMRPAEAMSALRDAGFSNSFLGACTAGSGGESGSVTSTDPPAGSSVPKDTRITVNFSRQSC